MKRLTLDFRRLTSEVGRFVFSRCGHGCGLFACIRSCISEGTTAVKALMEKVELLEVEVCYEVREQWLGRLMPSK